MNTRSSLKHWSSCAWRILCFPFLCALYPKVKGYVHILDRLTPSRILKHEIPRLVSCSGFLLLISGVPLDCLAALLHFHLPFFENFSHFSFKKNIHSLQPATNASSSTSSRDHPGISSSWLSSYWSKCRWLDCWEFPPSSASQQRLLSGSILVLQLSRWVNSHQWRHSLAHPSCCHDRSDCTQDSGCISGT